MLGEAWDWLLIPFFVFIGFVALMWITALLASGSPEPTTDEDVAINLAFGVMLTLTFVVLIKTYSRDKKSKQE